MIFGESILSIFITIKNNMSILDINQNAKEFLNLLCARLKNKYQENDIIVHKLQKIQEQYVLVPKHIDIVSLDKICKKFYFDFDMDKAPDINMGYTEDERTRIRVMIVNVLNEFTKCSM